MIDEAMKDPVSGGRRSSRLSVAVRLGWKMGRESGGVGCLFGLFVGVCLISLVRGGVFRRWCGGAWGAGFWRRAFSGVGVGCWGVLIVFCPAWKAGPLGGVSAVAGASGGGVVGLVCGGFCCGGRGCCVVR